jgi:Tfp pilus assembly protein PilN
MALVVLLGGLTFLQRQNVSHAKSQRAAVADQATKLKSQLATLAPVLGRQNQISTLKGDINTILATDLAWQKMINRITKNLPAGISLTTFTGTAAPPVAAPAVSAPAASTETSGSTTETTAPPTTVAPAPVVSGTVTILGKATDFPTLAAWIDAMSKVPEISDIYVTTAQRAEVGADGASGGVTFSATAVPSPAAKSNRVGNYVKAAAR